MTIISHLEIDAMRKVLASKGFTVPPLVLWEALEASKKAWAEAEFLDRMRRSRTEDTRHE